MTLSEFQGHAPTEKISTDPAYRAVALRWLSFFFRRYQFRSAELSCSVRLEAAGRRASLTTTCDVLYTRIHAFAVLCLLRQLYGLRALIVTSRSSQSYTLRGTAKCAAI